MRLRRLKRRTKQKWSEILLTILTGLLIVVSYNLSFAQDKIKTQKSQIDGLHNQLSRTQTALSEEADKVEVYRNYFSEYGSDTSNIVQDKYEVDGQYILIVGKDYYSVDEETFFTAEIGESIDTTGWEKTE